MAVVEKTCADVKCACEVAAREKRVFGDLKPLVRNAAEDARAEPAVAYRIRFAFPSRYRVLRRAAGGYAVPGDGSGSRCECAGAEGRRAGRTHGERSGNRNKNNMIFRQFLSVE